MRYATLVVSVLVLFSSAARAIGPSATLKRAERGEPTSLNRAFVLHAKSDGGEAEEIDIAIGKSIARHPKNFLVALKKNRAKVQQLGPMLGNLGEEFVDQLEMQRIELKRRLKAIQSVSDRDLDSVRSECEKGLQRMIDQIPNPGSGH
ncbi:MAG: hypothetical protein ACXWR1_04715 [Bdellovibrionota bacterium]